MKVTAEPRGGLDIHVFRIEVTDLELYNTSTETRHMLDYATDPDAPGSEILLALAHVAQELEQTMMGVTVT